MTPQLASPVQEEQTFVIVPQQFQRISRRDEITRALIFDSGTLINLSMNGLLYILEELKKVSDVCFLITPQVKYEIIDRPVAIPRFELGALRIKSLIDNGVIELPDDFFISNNDIKSETDELMHLANHTVSAKGKWIKIVSEAEMSCLALSSLLSEKGVESLIAVDERTTRILAEKPQNLEKLMSSRLHVHVNIETKKLFRFKDFKFIRSSELVYVAYKKGLLKIKDPRTLEAVLFATKFRGSSISYDEINVLKKL